jgi:DNA-binding PadR family transcriptional regulator
MATRRKVGNPLGLAVLAYLLEGPKHPYELSSMLRRRGDDRSVKFNHGSLYMVVAQLAKAGFLTDVATTRTGQRPERTVYALTDAGRAELRDWLRELVSEPEHEYPSFVNALSKVSALPPSEVAPLLRHRLDRLGAQRAEIQGLLDQAVADGVPELFVVEEQFRLAQTDTEIAFVERFLGQITDPENPWAVGWAQFHDALAPGGPPPQAPPGDGPSAPA